MHLFTNILLSGALALLVFLCFVNPRRVNVKANNWFGILLVCICVVISEDVYFTCFRHNFPPIVSLISDFPAFFIAPIFYLSISIFVNTNKVFSFKIIQHFVFGLVFCVFLLFRFFSENEGNRMVSIFYQLMMYLFFFQLIFYCYLSFKKIKKHQINIQNFSSNLEFVDLKWLENLTIGIVVLIVFWVLDMLFDVSLKDLPIINGILLFGIYYIAFQLSKQVEVFPSRAEEKELVIDLAENKDPEIEKKKLISDEDLGECCSQLDRLMSEQKPYFDEELNLDKLAKALKTTPHILSYILNVGFKENFYQYVNRHRIEEAKLLILDPKFEHLSLSGIGLEVGFKSKSVFQSAFKKIVGKTPSEYKKQASE